MNSFSSHISNAAAFRKRGGFPISIVAVLAPPWRKEVGDTYAVMDYLTINKCSLVLGFFMTHE